MKRFAAAVMVGMFFVVIAFGVFAMGHESGHNAGNCIAAVFQGSGACPGVGNLIAFLAFHLDAFKNLSAMAASAALGSFLLAFALGWMPVFIIHPPAPSRFGTAVRRARPDSFLWSSQIGFIRWLALHENSPATS